MEGYIGNDSVIVYLSKSDSNFTSKIMFVKSGNILVNDLFQNNSIKDSVWVMKLAKMSLIKDNFSKSKSILIKGQFLQKDYFKGNFIDSNKSSSLQSVELKEKYLAGSSKISYIDYNKDYYSFNDLKYDIQIIYPLIRLKDSVLNSKINKNITQTLFSRFENQKLKFNSIDNFVNDYLVSDFKSIEDDKDSDSNPADEKNIEDDDMLAEQDWYFHNFMEITLNESNLISVSCQTSDYMGGAHGGYNNTNININTLTGNYITLDSILKPGYKKKLDSLGRIAFANYINIPLDSLDNHIKEYFWFNNSKFELNNNFEITYTGLNFVFNQYEIASYADGIFEVFLSYNIIKDLIREDSQVYNLVNGMK
ncbi:MAG: RsiV family protein [Candidatus Kapabacteria bacterium]|nr:RsiV family protein [Candidatus Kapabacteria bacterium]